MSLASNGVLALAAIVARLEAALDPALVREIGGAERASRAMRELLTWPAAYVVPLSEGAGPNRYTGGDCVGQKITARFAVLIAARDIRQRSGADAVSELEALRIGIHEALLGWEPPGAWDQIAYAGGRIASDIGPEGLMVWQADYSTTLDLSRMDSP